MLTSFTKSDQTRNLSRQMANEIAAYDKYMDWFEYPSGLKGLIMLI